MVLFQWVLKSVIQRAMEWGRPQTSLWNLFIALRPSDSVSGDLGSWCGEFWWPRKGRSVCLTAHRLNSRAML